MNLIPASCERGFCTGCGTPAPPLGVSNVVRQQCAHTVGVVGDAETQRPDEAKTPTVTVIADTAEWRVLVAGWAFRFFSLIHDPEVAKLIGKTVNPKMTDYWCVSDFTKYLGKIGLSGDLGQLTRILKAMERAGLLLAAGWDRMQPIFFGQQYVTQGFTSPQLEGNLWLSEVLGAELIIPSYNAVTVLLAGTDLEGNPGQHWGTGLILDETHIVTNKHVVMGLVGPDRGDQLDIHPSSVPPGAVMVSRGCQIRAHKTLDVAVIEQLPEGGPVFPRLPGMVFREPRWADDVFVFGYPRVPMTAEMAITVQRGQVVNLARPTEYAVQRGEVVNPGTETTDRDKVFLFSAITRPGNSGGPIVAGDGRVIGLVVDDSAEAASSESGPESAPFYRGIPSSEVIRALDDLGFGGIIKTEREAKRLELKLTFPNGQRRFVGDNTKNLGETTEASDDSDNPGGTTQQ